MASPLSALVVWTIVAARLPLVRPDTIAATITMNLATPPLPPSVPSAPTASAPQVLDRRREAGRAAGGLADGPDARLRHQVPDGDVLRPDSTRPGVNRVSQFPDDDNGVSHVLDGIGAFERDIRAVSDIEVVLRARTLTHGHWPRRVERSHSARQPLQATAH